MAEIIPIVTIIFVIVALCAALLHLYRRLRSTQDTLGEMQQIAQDRMDRTAILSHEIRTPLALILGPVNLLLEESPGPLTAHQRTFLNTINRNARLVQVMSEDMLTQSRIEAGMFHMSGEEVDLRALGIRAISELRTLHSKPIVFDCPGMPPVVWGDPRLLLQAIVNLLNNALKHSEGAMATLRIQRQTTKTLVSIEDRGVGMTGEQRALAFHRYHTGASATGGVGLGMTITREIVRMHGSELHIQSNPHAGTTMMFSLPNAETPQ